MHAPFNQITFYFYTQPQGKQGNAYKIILH